MKKEQSNFLKIGGLVGLAIISGYIAKNLFERDKDTPKPNIVLFIVDDLRWNSLGCAGNPVVQTPSFDKLALYWIWFCSQYGRYQFNPNCPERRYYYDYKTSRG